MTNNSTTPNHVQAVSPKKTTKQLTAAYDILRAELMERVTEMDRLETQLQEYADAIAEIEAKARPLASAYYKLRKEAQPRAEIITQLCSLGIGDESVMDFDLWTSITGMSMVVTRFLDILKEENIPF